MLNIGNDDPLILDIACTTVREGKMPAVNPNKLKRLMTMELLLPFTVASQVDYFVDGQSDCKLTP